MKEVSAYSCDFCSSLYETKKEAKCCEARCKALRKSPELSKKRAKTLSRSLTRCSSIEHVLRRLDVVMWRYYRVHIEIENQQVNLNMLYSYLEITGRVRVNSPDPSLTLGLLGLPQSVDLIAAVLSKVTETFLGVTLSGRQLKVNFTVYPLIAREVDREREKYEYLRKELRSSIESLKKEILRLEGEDPPLLALLKRGRELEEQLAQVKGEIADRKSKIKSSLGSFQLPRIEDDREKL